MISLEEIEQYAGYSEFDLAGKKAIPKSVVLKVEHYDWLIQQAEQVALMAHVIKVKNKEMRELSDFLKERNIPLKELSPLITVMNRVEELERDRKYWYENYQQQRELSRGQISKLQKRVQELENRNKQLEYASKHNGELNEFLQKRKLPPNTLGRHVVDAVMKYVEELEKESQRYRELLTELMHEEQQNLEGYESEEHKRIREVLGLTLKEALGGSE